MYISTDRLHCRWSAFVAATSYDALLEGSFSIKASKAHFVVKPDYLTHQCFRNDITFQVECVPDTSPQVP